MSSQDQRQGSIVKSALDDRLDIWVEEFLFDRRAQNMAPGTLQYYRVKLQTFSQFCESRAIAQIEQITPDELRRFMLWLEGTGHNAGGRHALYRAVKTFLRWYESEAEPDNWKNPIRKVKPPRIDIEPLDPVTIEAIQALASTCSKDFTGKRDLAILLALLDTGARAQEFLNINLQDLNLISGSILIRRGKGGKPREVYLGKKARRAARAYLKMRSDDEPALWVTDEFERIRYFGLRSIIARRAKQAGIRPPGLHAFRRGCAILLWRNGWDVVSIARYLGHSGLSTVQRYLKQLPADFHKLHKRAGPVDGSGL